MRTEQESRRRVSGQRHPVEDVVAQEHATGVDRSNLQKILGNRIVSSALGGAGEAFSEVVRGEAAREGAGLPGMLMPDRSISSPIGRPDQVSNQLRRSTGSALPGAVARRLSSFLGHDVSHARVHTDAAAGEAARELHARAFALGADLFFAPGMFRPGTQTGDELLLHELKHVQQHDQGRIAQTTGLDVSSPSDALEIEARNAARSLGLGTPDAPNVGPRTAYSALASGIAHRDVQPGTQTQAPAPPANVTLALGGWTFQVSVPSSATPGASLTLSPPSSAIAGLSIRSLRVDVGQTFQVEGGQLTGSVTLGSYVSAPEVLLRVGRGGAIDGTVRGARLDLGQLASGTVDLQLSSGGISGSGQLTASQIHLAHALTLSAGQVNVSVDPAGHVAGAGSVSGQIQGVGPFNLAAQLSDTTLVGQATVDFAQPIALGSHVSLQSGHLAGAYSAESLAIQGMVALDVGNWARGDVSGSWSTANRQWNAAGTLSQIGSHALGELTISGGILQGAVIDGQVQPFQAQAHYTSTRGFEGDVTGAYDPAQNLFDGTGTATLTRPWQLGQVNVTQGAGQLTVTANQLVRFDGSATAEVPWQGQPTFLVTIPGVSLDLQSTVLSGSGTAVTTRDLVFGDNPQITVTAGASLQGTITENQLTAASGNAAFRVADPAGEFGAGNAELTFDPATGLVNGQATFAFTTNYGFPDRASEISYFKPGGSVTATITEGRLERADVNLPFAVQDPSGSGGTIDGTLVGSLVFATAQVDGTGTGTFATNWPVPVDFGTFQFVPGGTLSAEVVASQLSKITGDLPFETEVTGDPTLKFDGRVAGTLDVPATTVDGSATLTLKEEAPFALQNGDQLVGAVGSTATASVTANQIQSLAILLQAIYRSTAFGDLATGTLDGTVKLPSGLFTGQGDLTLNQDLPLAAEASGGERPEQWAAWLDAGANVHTNIVDDVPERTTISAAGHLDRLGERVAVAQLNGEYLLGDTAAGFTGTASADVVQRFDWSEGGRFTYQVDQGTHLDAALEASRLTQASGTVRLAILEGGADKAFATFSASYAPGTPLSGTGTAEVVADILLATRGDTTLNLAAGSAGNATIANDRLEKVDGTLKLRVDRAGAPFLGGDFTASWAATDADAAVDATGTATLLTDFELGTGHEYRYIAVTGSSANAVITASELQSLEGTLNIRVEDGAGPFLDANLNGRYTHPTPDFSGTGTVSVTREKDLEIASASGYRFFLLPGTSATAEVAALELVNATGALALRVDDGEGQLLQLDLDGSYTHASKTVSGTAAATLLRRYDLGTAGEYHCFAEPGSGLVASVTDNALSEITGDITATVEDGEGTFLRLTGAGRYSFQDPKALDFTGTANIEREKKLGEAGRFAVWVIPGTGATAVVTQNALQSLGGTITTRIDLDGQPFANVDLNGTWTPDAGFTGTGAARLIIPEWEAATMGRYSLWLIAGGGTQVDVQSNAITRLSAQLPIKIKEGGAEFMTGNVEGEYQFESRQASGSGSLTVVEEKQLPTGGSSEQFWLLAGSGANVTIAANQITSIGGNVHLAMRDGEGEYLDILFEGSYDTVEGIFNGSGGATITREKRLPTPGSPFALAPGAGAHATIENNQVTSVTGTIPFFVYNNGVKLLRGSVAGDWQASTNLINGSGEVWLASPQTFGPIELLADSGGTGEVVDSQLTRFTGTILATLSDSGGPLVDLSASGEFDAVNNKIVRAEGGASMRRNWEPISGLVISNVSGRGLIEDNEIREVDGAGQVAMEAIHATGTFDAHWRNEGGADRYWGTGSLDFDWAMGSASGRGLTGAGVSATLNEDQTFEATGTLEYAINERMKGDLEVTVDQNWDPELAGSFDAEGTIVEGKELFKKEMQLIPHMFVPVFPGVGIGFGMMGSMGMNLQPLTYTFGASISGFHPLHADVPDFEASLGVQGGVDFYGALAPYLGIGFGIPGVASATAGVEGQVMLNAPVTLGMQGKIFGRGGEYGGELGVSASIEPTLSLSVVPYARLDALGMSARWEFGTYPIASMNLFSAQWGTTYHFGDAGPTATPGAGGNAPQAAITASPATFPTTGPSGPPSVGTGNAQSPSSGLEGFPSIGGSDVSQESGTGGGLDGIMDKVNKIAAVAEGISAAQRLIGRGLVPFNPAELAVKIVTEWDAISADVQAVVRAIGIAVDWLTDLLPDWFWTLKGYIEDGIGAFQEAFGLLYEAGKWIVEGVSSLMPWNW